MKRNPEYYIEKTSNIDFTNNNILEINLKKTKLLVFNVKNRYTCYMLTYEDRRIDGFYYDRMTKTIIKFHCSQHYIQRFKERFLSECKLTGNAIAYVFAKRLVLPEFVNKRTLAEKNKRIWHCVNMYDEGPHLRINFKTCIVAKYHMFKKRHNVE